jgi:hypothetical protein
MNTEVKFFIWAIWRNKNIGRVPNLGSDFKTLSEEGKQYIIKIMR